jgi:hypothetical protein
MGDAEDVAGVAEAGVAFDAVAAAGVSEVAVAATPAAAGTESVDGEDGRRASIRAF